MRTAVLSDIHGNLEALEAVLEACGEQKADRIVCLGDVVGYGASPNECLDRVGERSEVLIVGNHDRAAAGLEGVQFMNELAASAIRWTREQLTAARVSVLRELSFTHRQDGVLFVHGSPESPEAFHYIFTSDDAEAALEHTDARLTFVGHSHRAFAHEKGQGEAASIEGPVALRDERRYLVNVGSVGQPRDRDPRGAFALWDEQEGVVELVRVPYDIEAAQERILSEGLPEQLAYRLALGT